MKCFSNAIELKINSGVSSETMDVINETDTRTYTTVCFVFGSAAIIASILISDLTLVFGFIAAFSETMLNFVFPGLFFFYASKMKSIPALLFVCLGLSLVVVSNCFNIMKMIR